jgi:hypothetical protein
VIDGKLYRPGQDCSRSYGGAVVVHHVRALSPGAFDEVEVKSVDGTRWGADGLHTLSAAGPCTLIDLRNAPAPRRS